MNISYVLKPFRKRLTVEALGRSAVLSGLIASCIAVILGILHLLFPRAVTRLGILLVFAGAFITGVLVLFFFVFRPSKRETAKRLDSLGLSERVETMLEYEHSTAPAAKLQRLDTLERLKTVKAKDVRIRIPKLMTMLCAIFFVCASVLLFLPEVNAFSRHPIINALNQMIPDSGLSEEFREDLEQIIEDLEENLNNSENDEEREQAIENAMGQIDDSVKKENSRGDLGGTLQNYGDLKELGEAIQNGDKEGVSSALDKLQEQMTDNPEKQQSVADQLQNALEESEVDPDNDLYEALENMKDGLTSPDQSLEETMDKAESEIGDALDKQENAENLGEQLKEQLENAKPSDSSENGEGQEGEGQEGEGEAGNQGEGQQPGQNGQQGGDSQNDGQNGSGNGSGGNAGMNEMIEDPDRGSVKYGTVYASYFAEFLKQAEEGQLPDSVVTAMNEYLENLKNGKGN